MVRRLVLFLVAVLGVWVIGLAIASCALGGRTGRNVAERVGESLQATATIAETDLALVRGTLELEDLAVRRDDVIGKLSLDVGAIRCDLPALGFALFDRSCDELVVRDVRLEISTTALFQLQRPKRAPFHADRVVLERAKVVFAPSAFVPSLGRVEIGIDRAVAGATTFKTPLSWLFALEELRATLALPAGITLLLTFEHGKLRVAGSLFGSRPIELPLALPVTSAADDAQTELRELYAFVRDLAQRLVAQRAQDWLESTLPLPTQPR